MQQSVSTIGVGTITDLYYYLLEKGVSEQALASLTGLAPGEINNPDARVATTCLPPLWQCAIEQSDNSAIALTIGNRVRQENLSIVAQVFLQSETLHQGIEQYVRFMSLVNDSMILSFEASKANAKLIFEIKENHYLKEEVERTVASAVARARHIMGDIAKPTLLEFQHEQPEYIAAYQEIFQAPLRFAQNTTAIHFDAALLSLKSSQRNPHLYQVLTNHAEALLNKLKPKNKTSDALVEFIRNNLSNPSLDVELAAKHLNMSRHTLYRKLKKDELSFQGLVDRIRQEEAEKLLQRQDISISEAAFVLGFSELSALSRAFKRWTGLSPAQFRQQHGALTPSSSHSPA